MGWNVGAILAIAPFVNGLGNRKRCPCFSNDSQTAR